MSPQDNSPREVARREAETMFAQTGSYARQSGLAAVVFALIYVGDQLAEVWRRM